MEDRLHYRIRDGVRYKALAGKTHRVEAGLKKRKAAEKDENEVARVLKRTKITYCVDSAKFYSSATQEELAREIKLEDLPLDEAHKTLQCKIRDCTTSLKEAVPLLTTYEPLKMQFNWLTNGDGISALVEENLGKHLNYLELYLRHENRSDCIKELEVMKDAGRDRSGDLYKLVGVLRATDIFFNPEKRPVLFNAAEDQLMDSSPRINYRMGSMG